jgi:hypothetical protein
MDRELREAFEQFADRLRQHIDAMGEDLRAEIRTGDGETRETLRAEIRAGDAETRETLRAEIRAGDAETRETLRAEIRAGDAETRETLRAEIRAGGDETRRHVGVLNEALRADFRIATEGIDALTQKFDAVRDDQELTLRRLDLLESRVTVLEQGARSRRRRR